MKAVIVFFASILISTFCFAQNVKWMSMQEALDAQKSNYRPVFVDVYTDWCGWCKKMDASTFSHPEIAKLLNNYFYPVKFDAEGNDTITFKGKVYTNENWATYQQQLKAYEAKKAAGEAARKPRKPTHSIASVLLNGRLSYPTTVYIHQNENYFPAPGYMDPKKIQPLLIWVGEGALEANEYTDFKSEFDNIFSSPNHPEKTNVNWISFEEALEKQKTEPRKLFILFQANWMVTSNMIEYSVNDTSLAKYINEKYYPIKFDVTSKDSFTAFGQTWSNNSEQASIHPIVGAMLQNQLKFPALIWMNEENKMINKIQNYFTAEQLEPMFQFFGENKYLEMNWQEFQKQ